MTNARPLLSGFFKTTPFAYLHFLKGYCNLIASVTTYVIWLGFQLHNTQIIRKLGIFVHVAFFPDWHKKSLATSFFVIVKWDVFPFGWYSTPSNIVDQRKASAYINAALFDIIIAISLFGPIKIEIVVFLLGLIYFRSI